MEALQPGRYNPFLGPSTEGDWDHQVQPPGVHKQKHGLEPYCFLEKGNGDDLVELSILVARGLKRFLKKTILSMVLSLRANMVLPERGDPTIRKS